MAMTEEEEMHSKAMKIQAIARGRKQRRGDRSKKRPPKKTEEELAAAKLQAMQRGKLGRQKVKDMQEQKLAAARIQSIHRGRGARRSVEAKKSGGLILELRDVRKGLSQLARNPFTLKHSFVSLQLPGSSLKEMEVISNFPNLQEVNLSENSISDLSPLAKLPYLLKLDCSKNALTECLDYDVPICDEENRLADGEHSIGSMLHEAKCSFNEIESIRDLSGHRFLHTLDLGNNKISKIDGLQNLGMLTTLILSNNKIGRIEGLEGLPIINLNLECNLLTSIDNLDKLPRLEKLYLNDNKIETLKGLPECLNLREVDLGNNEIKVIRQVEFLAKISKLAQLNLKGNDCSKLEFYRLRVMSRLSGLAVLDGEDVSAEEKVKAVNLYGGEGSDLANRKATWAACFPDQEFVDFLPSFQEDEEDMVGGEEKKEAELELGASGTFVDGVMSAAISSVVSSA
ncbi:hypothetical protein TrLO_g3694 [Triparma laevis f. longispina]|uniref:Uncharacterized protein n=1 Tax=Triparma laevis f. longispina TaxID=1714387 RepID=A0A9W7FI78_9STRA|nr:hypothetical protein TrLO_g3694 [Triparma laevis f. longispina]